MRIQRGHTIEENSWSAAESSNTLAETLAGLWPNMLPEQLIPLTRGVNNSVYRVESANQPPRILRIYRTLTDIERMRHEVALHEALAQVALPFAVPAPIPARDGLLIQDLDATPNTLGGMAVLWTHIRGAHPGPAHVDQARASGAALALLDRALATIDPESLPGRATAPLGNLKRRIPHLGDAKALLRRVPLPAEDTAELLHMFAKVEQRISALYASLPQQLIHGDMDRSNVLMEGTQVTGMLDFEFSGRDLRIADLLVPLTWWPLTLFDSGAEWDVLDALGQGYTSCLPLRPDELEALPLLFRLRGIGGLLYRLARFRRGHETEQQIVERVAWTLGRERWLRRNEEKLLSLTRTWRQEP